MKNLLPAGPVTAPVKVSVFDRRNERHDNHTGPNIVDIIKVK